MTDRAKVKDFQEGQYVTIAGITSAKDVVDAVHSRPYVFSHRGGENAATNVDEASGCTILRAGRLKGVKVSSQDAVANDASDYVKLYIYKRTAAGATQTLIASWNSEATAEGSLAAFGSHACTLSSTSSALDLAAGITVTYHVGKTGSGKALNDFVVTLDVEEV